MPQKETKSPSTESMKLIVSEAFFPFFLIVIAKLLGMFLLPTILKYNYQVKFATDSFPLTFIFGSDEQAQLVNSYTNLAMYAVAFFGFLWVLVRSYHFHDSHIKPTTTAKLAELKMLHLITTSFEVYHSAFIWFCFMWLSTIAIALYYLMNLSYLWTFMTAFLSSVLMTYLLIDDLEKEFYIWRLFNESQ